MWAICSNLPVFYRLMRCRPELKSWGEAAAHTSCCFLKCAHDWAQQQLGQGGVSVGAGMIPAPSRVQRERAGGNKRLRVCSSDD